MSIDCLELKRSFQSLSTRYGGSLLLEKQLLPKAVSAFVEEKRNLDFFEILNRAGYRPAEATPIQWNFVRPEFNVMQTRTNMGDDVNFGNFIILLRSNPYWGMQLKKGVELFGKLHNIYEICYGTIDR